MSSKFIHTLSDENPDLQKQIGCMNGIFQLFERHHFLSSRGQITGQNNKRPSSGQNSNHNNVEPKSASPKATEKCHKKGVKEKPRMSSESSRTFSSSSCSSSLSSSECNNRASQLEPSSFSQTSFAESHARDSPIYQLNASFCSSQQSPDLRDVVKDSIYREARGLSVKTATRGESRGQTLKYFDSPRPVQHPKSPNPKVSGLKESFQILNKLQEAPRKSDEGRRASLPPVLKDARRFSCDGRESRDASKSTIKLRELPRLSLDSRAGSTRGSTTELKSNYIPGDLDRRDGSSNNFLNQNEEPESRIRLSNVVAKLMGLEALPDSISANKNQKRHTTGFSGAENHRFLGSPRTTKENNQIRVSGSPRNHQKEPVSPQMRNAESVKKPNPNSKFPLEPAPWKQPDSSRSSPTPALKNRATLPKAPNSPLSVYGEIEKRLSQLEFNQSGKDLRALKQILEAMQKTKEALENKNETPKTGTRTNNSSSPHSNSKSASNLCNIQSESPISSFTRRSSSPNTVKSSIVIMKPTKFLQKASNPASLVNPPEHFPVLHRLQTTNSGKKESTEKRTSVTTRANHIKERPSVPSRSMNKNPDARLSREGIDSGRSSGNSYLRRPQKTFGLENQTRPVSPSDSIRSRRQSNRQPIESGSPRRKPRSKFSNLQPSDDELSDVGSDVRDLSHHGDAISLQSESTFSLASHADEEVSSTDRSYKIANQKQKKPAARTMKDKSGAEPAATSEQPSPVSVLDATFYSDDLPSPIKKKSIAFKEDEVEWNKVDQNHSNSSINSMINHQKAENLRLQIQDFTQKLPTREEPYVAEITSFYHSTNPDHRYISEVLSASGLLKDFESGFTTNGFHPTGYPINPTLFIALEQDRASTLFPNDKESRAKFSKSEHQMKLHRKLVFDVVNETLIHKLLSGSSSKHGKIPRGEQLCVELCSEVDRLQGIATNCSLDDEEDSLTNVLLADLMYQSKNWKACTSEFPGLVLDIERLIFKDLISEIITAEAIGLLEQSAGHCRQLFSK